MIPLSPATRIFLASGATDLRKSFEGLSDLVAHQFKEDPLSGHLYVFANRRKNRIKLLYFDGTGVWVCAKRLMCQGCFAWPKKEACLPPAQKENPLPRSKPVRPNHPGREKLPEHLERREVIIPCHPKDCRCDQCGAERPIIGYERSEELVCDPATFHVRVTLREKRGSHCQEEQGVATAPAPAKIVPKSKLSDEFIIEALARKYQQHTPVYRQCAALADSHGIDLSRATLTAGILAAGGLLAAVVRAQAQELRKSSYLQADETTVPVQTGEKSGRNHRAYIWEYSVPGGPVVFDFQMGRGREGPEKFLLGFRGTLQCDGYAAYDKLGEGIVYAGCMAHARRGFVEAAKLAPQNPLPAEIVERIGQLYAVEEKARQAGLGPVERAALRQSQSAPVLEALKLRLVEIRQQIPPGGKLAQACDYALGQWSRLEEYLKNGLVEIDNNWCEGAMRPLALGRNYGEVVIMRRCVGCFADAGAFRWLDQGSTAHN